MQFRDDPDNSRYAAEDDGQVVGLIEYRVVRDDRLVLVHTEVDDAFSGQGIGSSLARGALDDVRERGIRIRVKCPFMKKFVDSHEEYADLQA